MDNEYTTSNNTTDYNTDSTDYNKAYNLALFYVFGLVPLLVLVTIACSNV